MLATDGRTSFAAFIYENLENLLRTDVVIGFNKGDRQSFAVIAPGSIDNNNVYRIDGMYHTIGKSTDRISSSRGSEGKVPPNFPDVLCCTDHFIE